MKKGIIRSFCVLSKKLSTPSFYAFNKNTPKAGKKAVIQNTEIIRNFNWKIVMPENSEGNQ